MELLTCKIADKEKQRDSMCFWSMELRSASLRMTPGSHVASSFPSATAVVDIRLDAET
jgi:hypothetical protein